MENKNKKTQKSKDPQSIARILPQEGKETILSDVTGSYTGTPMDSTQPIQDADDL